MPQRRWFPWLALALWIAGALVLARLGAVLLNDVPGKPAAAQALELTLWRLEGEVWTLWFLALGAGALCAWLALAIARTRALALTRFAAIAAACGLVQLYLLRGWTLTRWPEADDPFGPFGIQGFLILFVLAAVLGASIAVAGFAIRYDTSHETPFADASGLVLGVLLVLAGPLLLSWWSAAMPPYRIRHESAHDVLAERAFAVEEQHPAHPVEVATIDPFAGSGRESRAEQALLLSPPAEVVLRLPEAEGPLFLRLKSGVDGAFLGSDSPITLRLSLAVAGEVVFTQDLAPEEELDLGQRAWREIGGPNGLRIEPGSEVRLASRIVKPVGLELDDVPRIAAGFADVLLQREVKKLRRRVSDDTPNVILLELDSLRADRLSCYGHAGYARPLTPHIDALAARGTLYENAYADTSWTEPSAAALLTGLGSERHGLLDARVIELAAQHETLAEALARRGYATGAFVEHASLAPERGFGQGFDGYERGGGERLETALAAWIADSRDTPFFAWVQLTGTRVPYRTSEAGHELVGGRQPVDYPRRGPRQLLLDEGARLAAGTRELTDVLPPAHQAWLSASYDMGVHGADELVGRLLALLAELELDQRTIVVVTSDHGEELLDHGFVQHGHDLHEELVHVPLVLAGRGIPRGQRVQTPVENRHVAPTLARLCGVELAAAATAPGNAPAPPDLARPGDVPAGPVFFSTLHGLRDDPRDGRTTSLFGVRDGRWSLILAPAWETGADGQARERVELFDLDQDPRQTSDLAAREPERCAALRALLAGRFGALLERPVEPSALEAPEGAADDASGAEPGTDAPRKRAGKGGAKGGAKRGSG